ncbi:LysR family transcriptional regulator [Hoeflea olei]|uniref:LysR family transcriptional regulator n=1 Tax=Hoeflea olei TaxID=1480615 RepID=A0A1C1YWF9_9HYPH|nr:LysR family transcriptional regulator [Hoeflea olei]OCW57759.1 LysR family transcriptional regulator [Hoeflea olei]
MPVSPPRPKGPPLNALRAFEAAARLGGIALAADELCVTPGAISQHIKTLEQWAGVKLFERRAHGVELTKAGRELAPDFTAAFDQMGLALHALRRARPQPAITIAALPCVAQLWLPRHLTAFRLAVPAVRLSVVALETPPHLKRELFDCSLFIRDPEETATGIVLARDEIFPVCAPAIAARLKNPADLSGEVLLHDAVWSGDWPLWAEAAGLASQGFSEGPRYSLYGLALEEAKSGAGVLMGHAGLVDAALARGELVRPFAESVATGKALVLDMPSRPAPSSQAARFCEFLVQNGAG